MAAFMHAITAPCDVQARSMAAAADASGQRIDKAAALVIGDEILSGAIQDSNTPWLAKLLHSQGVDMMRFEYVPDDVQEIKEAVKRLKGAVGDAGAIFCSGVRAE
jgi:molybdopterin biosynthesis enzyme MoaB